MGVAISRQADTVFAMPPLLFQSTGSLETVAGLETGDVNVFMKNKFNKTTKDPVTKKWSPGYYVYKDPTHGVSVMHEPGTGNEGDQEGLHQKHEEYRQHLEGHGFTGEHVQGKYGPALKITNPSYDNAHESDEPKAPRAPRQPKQPKKARTPLWTPEELHWESSEPSNWSLQKGISQIHSLVDSKGEHRARLALSPYPNGNSVRFKPDFQVDRSKPFVGHYIDPEETKKEALDTFLSSKNKNIVGNLLRKKFPQTSSSSTSVRGWHNYSPGFTTSEASKGGGVIVGHVTRNAGRNTPMENVYQSKHDKLEDYAKHLEDQGLNVERQTEDYGGKSYNTSLHIPVHHLEAE